ncbi:MAG: response regulator, partial [Geminicoccaceae bacterium]
MDGTETLKRLRAMPGFADTPIVFMTAKAQSHEIDAYKALGAAGVITKPFDPMTLVDDVRAIWNRAQ